MGICCIEMAECFPSSDHRLLTNYGYVYLDQILAHLALPPDHSSSVTPPSHAWRGLMLASYDAERDCIVYDTPVRLIVRAPAGKRTELIQMCNDDDHDDGGGDVSVVMTHGHAVYARQSSHDSFGKLAARDAVHAHRRAPLQLKTAARAGVALDDDDIQSMQCEPTRSTTASLTKQHSDNDSDYNTIEYLCNQLKIEKKNVFNYDIFFLFLFFHFSKFGLFIFLLSMFERSICFSNCMDYGYNMVHRVPRATHRHCWCLMLAPSLSSHSHVIVSINSLYKYLFQIHTLILH